MSVALVTSDERHSPRGELVAALAERLKGATVVTTTGSGWGGAVHVDEATPRTDVAVGFGWRACVHLLRLDAGAYAHYVSALEDALIWHGDERRILAALSYDLPSVTLIADSADLAEALRVRAPDAEIVTVTRGFDKDALAPAARSDDAPLRVLVAGEAAAVLEQVREPIDARPLPPVRRGDAYRRADVLLELAPSEQPLAAAPEAMHTGCVPVVTPVRGHAEFVGDGQTGVVVAFDDVPGAARALDLLARDRGRLAELREATIARAAQLPSLDDVAKRLQSVLDALPSGHRPPQRLLLNAVAAVEVVSGERRALEQYAHDLQNEIEELQRDNAEVAALRKSLAEREPAYRVGNALRPLWRPLLPLVRLLRRIRR